MINKKYIDEIFITDGNYTCSCDCVIFYIYVFVFKFPVVVIPGMDICYIWALYAEYI